MRKFAMIERQGAVGGGVQADWVLVSSGEFLWGVVRLNGPRSPH